MQKVCLKRFTTRRQDNGNVMSEKQINQSEKRCKDTYCLKHKFVEMSTDFY